MNGPSMDLHVYIERLDHELHEELTVSQTLVYSISTHQMDKWLSVVT